MEVMNGTLSIFTITKSTKSPCPPMENMSQVNLHKSGSMMASIFVDTTYCFLVWIKMYTDSGNLRSREQYGQG